MHFDPVAEIDNVYADQMREIFTRYTGLETSLGTMGASRRAHGEATKNPRGITEGEERLLQHIIRWGSDGYGVILRSVGRGRWIWGDAFGIKGPPKVFKTKAEATKSLEAFLDVLADAKAGRI